MTILKKIYDFLENLAPFKYSDKFDNSGLIVGDFDSKINKILLALDVTNDVIHEAVRSDFNLIITHHPVIFHPLKHLSFSEPAVTLAKNGINCIGFHTNFDVADGGISDIMADLLKINEQRRILEVISVQKFIQFVVFVPDDYAEKVYEAMTLAGAGLYGEYTGCAYFSSGSGRFIPSENAKPYIGKSEKLENVRETRIELLVAPEKLNKVTLSMKKAHPYESPAFSLTENSAFSREIGYGRIAEIENFISCEGLLQNVKNAFNTQVLRYTDSKKPIKKIAVCSGSGASLLENARALDADAFVTGDIKHDRFVDAKNMEITLVDAGHFETEKVGILCLYNKLCNEFPDLKIKIADANISPICIF